MNFDITSMKQRAKMLMKETKPSPKLFGIVFEVLAIFYVILFFFLFSKSLFLVAVLAELVYLNFRTCRNWYALKLTREEKTSFSDCFCVFQSKTGAKAILLGIVRELLWAVGAFVLIVGVIFPIYWFRFAPYIMKDEDTSVFKALAKSKKLIKGHYSELIKLDILCIVWQAIVFFTNGIAGFYAKPYVAILYAEFYDYLKACKELNA